MRLFISAYRAALRPGRLACACLLAGLLTIGLLPASAGAAKPKGKTARVVMTVTCSAVHYTYTGFPNAPNNTVHDTINVNSHKYKKETFVFNGPTGENTVMINLPPGNYTIKSGVTWNTNGLKGESTTLKTVLTCTGEPKPAYTIEKLQEIEGSKAGFTKSELRGKDGQTVDYEIIVTNTGNVTLKFGPLSDPKCDGNLTERRTDDRRRRLRDVHLPPRTVRPAGSYGNTASIEGNEGTGTQTSNEVVANIVAAPSFTIEKLQEIEGEVGFTQLPLSGKDGQTVDYEVIVKNTGKSRLKFKPLLDAKCTGISPTGEVTIAAGSE